MNFNDRAALIINNCPLLEILEFSFLNSDQDGREVFRTDARWGNVSTSGLIAFELVCLFVDPFHQKLNFGGRWLVPGHNSVNWRPLPPGGISGDGLIGHSALHAYMGVLFVRSVRLSNGVIWRYSKEEVYNEVLSLFPGLDIFE